MIPLSLKSVTQNIVVDTRHFLSIYQTKLSNVIGLRYTLFLAPLVGKIQKAMKDNNLYCSADNFEIRLQ